VSAKVRVSIVTFNSAAYLKDCLASLKGQDYGDYEVCLWDNGSTDASLEIARSERGLITHLHASACNLGFCAGHNRAIAASSAAYVLILNPDVFLQPCYLGTLLSALENDPRAGSGTGKLWRWPEVAHPGLRPPEPRIIDSTGIYFTRNQRHLDRGSGETDTGCYDRREYVFGASGAAALYRRDMLEEVKAGAEYFDESFFAYREDADLAWRAQWMGWRCLYVPDATAYHVRRVLPQRRAVLPADINMHSFKNRFLLRAKNMDAGMYARYFLPITARDLLALGYVLLRERSSLRALPLLFKALPKARKARRDLQKRRRTPPREMRRWFSDRPASVPLEPADAPPAG
jgi:GT2 family glycosyltransferase